MHIADKTSSENRNLSFLYDKNRLMSCCLRFLAFASDYHYYYFRYYKFLLFYAMSTICTMSAVNKNRSR